MQTRVRFTEPLYFCSSNAICNATAVLEFSENVVSLFTHEVAMHHNQNLDDSGDEGRPKVLGPVQISSLKECVKACHSILDSILSMEFDEYYAQPLMFCKLIIKRSVCLFITNPTSCTVRVFNGMSHKALGRRNMPG